MILMEQITKPKALTVLILIPILILIPFNAWLVHSRNLASSPAPAPASVGFAAYTRGVNPHEGRKAKPRWGSFPTACHSKCNQCRPCVPVEVSIRTMEMEENQYYPIAWRCMCNSNIFLP